MVEIKVGFGDDKTSFMVHNFLFVGESPVLGDATKDREIATEKNLSNMPLLDLFDHR